MPSIPPTTGSPAATTTTFTTSRFFSLAPELRNDIYALVFSDLEAKVTLPLIRSEASVQAPKPPPHIALALLLTCRQVASEAHAMAWRKVPANFFNLMHEGADWGGFMASLGEVDEEGECNTLVSAKAMEVHVTKEAELLRKTMGAVLPHLTILKIDDRDALDMLQGSAFFFGKVEIAAIAIRSLLTNIQRITFSKDFDFFFKLADLPECRDDREENEDGLLQLDDAPWVYPGAFKKFHALFPKVSEIIMVQEGIALGLAPRTKAFIVKEGELFHGDTGNSVYRKRQSS